MRKLVMGSLLLAAWSLRAQGWEWGGHAGALVPGCGLKRGLHGEEWGVEAGLALIRSLGPRAEGRLEAGFGGLAGRAAAASVNVERLALMACFRYHPLGGRPFVVLALGTSRYRSHLSERSPGLPPAAARRPMFSLGEDGSWHARDFPSGTRAPAPASVPGEETGFRPAWGLGAGLAFGRHLEAEIRWEAMAHGGRTLGAWHLRAGFRF